MPLCPICETEQETYTRPDGEAFKAHDGCSGGYAIVAKASTYNEDRYTAARADCPHPERWRSYDWDSAEVEVSDLVAAFVRALRPDYVVETGTAFGQTAYAIGIVLAEAGVGHLYTVEVDHDRVVQAQERCKDLPVTVVEKDSLEFDPPDGIGFAWFDSLLGLRIPEFRAYYKRFAKHATVGFHDTGPHFPIWPHIEALETEGLLLPIRLPTPRGVVFGEVL